MVAEFDDCLLREVGEELGSLEGGKGTWELEGGGGASGNV